jgi:hypothetical protein
MEFSQSWEDRSYADTQDIPNIFWNPKVHMNPPIVPILNQINAVHATPSYFSKFHFNIIHPPLLLSS